MCKSDVQYIFSAPSQPNVSVTSVTTTSISLSWTHTGLDVKSYEVFWRLSEESIRTSVIISDVATTTYTIMGLQSASSYIITVNATNAFASSSSSPIDVSTDAEREHTHTHTHKFYYNYYTKLGGCEKL